MFLLYEESYLNRFTNGLFCFAITFCVKLDNIELTEQHNEIITNVKYLTRFCSSINDHCPSSFI